MSLQSIKKFSQKISFISVPEDYKLNPGAVECIEEQPGKPDNILIGYNRGLMILWDKSKSTAIKSFVVSQQLESICWNDNGESFYSSHNDGELKCVIRASSRLMMIIL